MRLFQRDAYIGIDFLEKKTEVVRLTDETANRGMLDIPIQMGNGEQKLISVQMPEVEDTNAIRMELSEFAESIRSGRPVRVSVYDGYQAMDVAHQILQKIQRSTAV